MNPKFARLFGVPALILSLLIVGATAASATPTDSTTTLRWITTAIHTPPTNADDVTWPQALDDGSCGTGWIQVDVYDTSTPEKTAKVQALKDAATLTYPGSPGSDSDVIISWSFEPQTACETSVTPTTDTPTTDAPTTEVPTSAPPTTQPPVVTDSPSSSAPVATQSVATTTSQRPAVAKSTSKVVVALKASSVSSPPEPATQSLAYTGSGSNGRLAAIAFLVIGAGVAIVLGSIFYERKRRHVPKH